MPSLQSKAQPLQLVRVDVVRRLDANIESNFVKNQNMIAQNLLTAEETRQYREMGIQDKFDGIRNQAYGKLEIAPTFLARPSYSSIYT